MALSWSTKGGILWSSGSAQHGGCCSKGTVVKCLLPEDLWCILYIHMHRDMGRKKHAPKCSLFYPFDLFIKQILLLVIITSCECFPKKMGTLWLRLMSGKQQQASW